MSIKVGDYVIMNNSDKPCTRLIAQVIELPEGKDFVRGRYICKNTNMRYPQGRLSEATLVSDFGVELSVELSLTNGKISTEQVRPSVATYSDGKPRQWQPDGENPEQELWEKNAKN